MTALISRAEDSVTARSSRTEVSVTARSSGTQKTGTVGAVMRWTEDSGTEDAGTKDAGTKDAEPEGAGTTTAGTEGVMAQETKVPSTQGLQDLQAPRHVVEELEDEQQGTQQPQGSTTKGCRTQAQRKRGLETGASGAAGPGSSSVLTFQTIWPEMLKQSWTQMQGREKSKECTVQFLLIIVDSQENKNNLQT